MENLEIKKDTKFASLIDNAVGDLSGIGERVVLAMSPNRFNDVYWYDWRAIAIGNKIYESDHGQKLDKISEFTNENTNFLTAYSVFQKLETENWDAAFLDAINIPWDDEVLALIVDDNKTNIVFSSSNGSDRNHVFEYNHVDKNFLYVGECDDGFYQDLKIHMTTIISENPDIY